MFHDSFVIRPTSFVNSHKYINYLNLTCKIVTSVVEYFGMIQVTRKDNKEGLENLIRRFNRKVASAGIITTMKNGEFFTKPISKVERRKKAIIRKARKSEKMKRIRLGQR